MCFVLFFRKFIISIYLSIYFGIINVQLNEQLWLYFETLSGLYPQGKQSNFEIIWVLHKAIIFTCLPSVMSNYVIHKVVDYFLQFERMKSEWNITFLKSQHSTDRDYMCGGQRLGLGEVAQAVSSW